jgi:uncharacterized protein
LDLAHIAGLAAAVAWRADFAASLPLPVRGGLAHLPGLGALRVAGHGITAVVSIAEAGRLPSEWIGTRQLTAASMYVTVDDLDPYRVNTDRKAWNRVPLPRWKAWKDVLSEAVHELYRLVPRYAEPLCAGLRVIVPLRSAPVDHGPWKYGTQCGFGAAELALSDKVASIDIAAALLREFQRIKLSALMDMYAFFTVAGPPVRLPHRVGPLPVRHALHDLYAHVSLAELWRARSFTPSQLGDREEAVNALTAFQHHRERADCIVDALADAGVLAPAGVRFTAGLRTAIDHLVG